MDGRGRKRTLIERLEFLGIGCCGSTWGIRETTISVREEEEEEEERDNNNNNNNQGEQSEESLLTITDRNMAGNGSDPVRRSPGMNLAAALAAERNCRDESRELDVVGPGNGGTTGSVPGTPFRMSLMRLLEETEGGDFSGKRLKETEGGLGGRVSSGYDWVCCVCMERNKGAALIPCGHTFCRVCSRELWLNRGSCPLCNRTILEILDIF